MQKDVKVFIPEMLVAIFPGLTVKKKPFHYNLHVDTINGDELIKLADVVNECAIDIFLYRFDKGITIKITPHPEGYIQKAPYGGLHEKVRDFYEFVLPQEAGIFAFENTAKIKLDRPAKNLFEAILESFYIADTPQGANYWQDIILENTIR